MASNGRLPQSELGRIYHPSHKLYLQKDAAASWNTMRLFLCRYLRKDIYPNGPISAYRTYDQQVEAKKIYGSNAATPGTSNHGLGLAVDLASQDMRKSIDRFGAHFGWAKKWSDASWEWWHLKYRVGVWKQRPDPGISLKYPVAQLGSGGRGQKWFVRKIQRRLRAHGFPLKNTGGEFNKNVQKNVIEFQKSKKLKPDGVVGYKTWQKLLKKPVFKPEKPSKPPVVKPKPNHTDKPKQPENGSQTPLKPNRPIKAELIDVSVWQGDIDWVKVKKANIVGAYLKLSEGGDFKDKSATPKRIEAMKKAGVKYGYYHFLRPKKRDAALEARWFIAKAKELGGWGDYIPCVDIEVTELNAEDTGNYLARFISVLRKEGDSPEVVVYSAPGWWKGKVKRTPSLGLQFPYCKAWIAHWDVGTPDPLDGLPGFVLHQYTDTGKVDGISTNVDRNYTNNLKELYR